MSEMNRPLTPEEEEALLEMQKRHELEFQRKPQAGRLKSGDMFISSGRRSGKSSLNEMLKDIKRRENVDKTVQDATDAFGFPLALDLMIEECAETIQAIIHLNRGRVRETKVIEELADVYIVTRQLLCEYERQYPGLFDDIVEEKVKRLAQRIVEDNPNLR